MAFIQRNLPPPSQKQVKNISNFSGGINNVSDDGGIQDNQLSSLINAIHGDADNFEKRHGQEYYDSSHINDSITHLSEYVDGAGTSYILKGTNSEVYKNNTKIADVNGEIHTQMNLGDIFFTDGADLFWHGEIQDLSANAHYTMKGWSAGYHTLKVVNPADDFTPLEAPNKIGVWVYDYTAGTVHYEPCKAELDDVIKGANFVPDNPSVIVNHGQRMFLSGDKEEVNQVFLSDIDNPFYYPVAMGIGLEPNGDKIVGMKVFMDSVVIGRANDLYVLYGNTAIAGLNNQFNLKKINTHTGFANKNAVEVMHNYLCYLGSDDKVYIMITTQTNVNVLTTAIINKTCDFTRQPFSLDTDEISKAQSVFFDNKFYLVFGKKIAIYDYVKQSWSQWENFNVSSVGVYDGQILFGSTDGKLIKIGDEFMDFDLPYPGIISTKRFTLGDSTLYKQFREIYVLTKTYLDFISDVHVEVELDFIKLVFSYVTGNEIARWGYSEFGDKFYNTDIPSSDSLSIGQRGRVIKLNFRNGKYIDETFDTEAQFLVHQHVSDKLYYVKETKKFYEYINGQIKEIEIRHLNQPFKLYEFTILYEPRGRR